MKNLGSFNEESISLFKEHFEDNLEFSESTEDFQDFARCQRPDGSFYGTSGQCRKGKETSAKSKTRPKAAVEAEMKKLTSSGALQQKGIAGVRARQKFQELKAQLAPAPKGKIKDPVPGVLKQQKETARIKKEAMADQMKKNPKLAKMAADMKARKAKEAAARMKP
jgi:hypothetical protein